MNAADIARWLNKEEGAMRALTLKQPWAWAICHAGKRVENRSWPIPPKLLADGPLWVMIHAGAAWDASMSGTRFATLPDGTQVWAHHGARAKRDGGEWVQAARTSRATRQPFSAVVAVVEFTGCHDDGGRRCCRATVGRDVCSPWAEIGDVWHWEIGRVVVLDDPVPAKGRLGLWTPEDDVADAVQAQLDRADGVST